MTQTIIISFYWLITDLCRGLRFDNANFSGVELCYSDLSGTHLLGAKMGSNTAGPINGLSKIRRKRLDG